MGLVGMGSGRQRRPAAEIWGLGVVNPIKIMILGSSKQADVPIGSKAHVRGGNLVSEFQSEAGKAFDLCDLYQSPANASSDHPPADQKPPSAGPWSPKKMNTLLLDRPHPYFIILVFTLLELIQNAAQKQCNALYTYCFIIAECDISWGLAVACRSVL